MSILKNIKLFVYGTLKEGGKYSHYMSDCKFIKKMTIRGYTLLGLQRKKYGDLWYPLAVKATGRKIIGELYEVEPCVYEGIRYMEECGHLKPIQIGDVIMFFADGKSIQKLTAKNTEHGRNYNLVLIGEKWETSRELYERKKRENSK